MRDDINKKTCYMKFFPRWIVMLFFIICIFLTLLMCYIFIIAQSNLPDIETITDYKPKVPLRIYTADNVLIGEFGEERRHVVSIQEIPMHLKNAVLAIEDERFYYHKGIDYYGILRAALHNITGNSIQGASTITMQIARNFFLNNEKSFNRKIYEILLAQKIEKKIPKHKILELYMNQIYLGQHAYGFSSAARIYFGKDIRLLSIAESAMLAGLPKAPSIYNPVVNYQRAKIRQEYILYRMKNLKMITEQEYDIAKIEKLHIKGVGKEFLINADFVSEMVRNTLYQQYGDKIYTNGMTVITTIRQNEQNAAYTAVQKGVINYEINNEYRGPVDYIDLPKNQIQRQQAIDSVLTKYSHDGNLFPGVVIGLQKTDIPMIRVIISTGETISIQGDSLKLNLTALANHHSQIKERIRIGSVIFVSYLNNRYVLSQLPQIEAAFVALDTQDGAIRALVGGIDFNKNKFNHVYQAYRQPGSSFKPFVYAAAIEKGLMPNSIVQDSPLSISRAETGSDVWEPKNYNGKFEGRMTVRNAFAKSKNLAAIRIIRKISPQYVQNFIKKFGFESEKHPPYLSMALGSGLVTPIQMAVGYAVFANGGYLVQPYLINKIYNQQGEILFEATPSVGDSLMRILDQRTAFIMDSLLLEVVKSGTAASIKTILSRKDIAGKTGTTNDSTDVWFAGYHPNIVAISWVGFDKLKSLGDRITGSGLALPIWINYMQSVLNTMPEYERKIPDGVIQKDGDWIIPEFLSISNNMQILD